MVQEQIPEGGGISEEEKPSDIDNLEVDSGTSSLLLKTILSEIYSSQKSEFSEFATIEEVELAIRGLKAKALSKEIDARESYAERLFYLVVGWLLVSSFIVFASGAEFYWSTSVPNLKVPILGKFHLSDSVLITLMTTTTASVIGLFLIVIKYFFSNSVGQK